MSWFDGVTAQSTASVGADGPLVSVVVPVYNDESWIADCLESVLAQTYPNWSLTIVDNCSNDRTPEIAEMFCRRDSRVRHHRFEELVDANVNHSRAFASIDPESDYCKVVQADDFIFPQCLEQMIALANRHSHVGLVLGYRRFEGTVDLVSLPLSRETAPGAELLRRSLLEGPQLLGPPTAQLFRSDLVRRRTPFYDATFFHADVDAACWLLRHADFGLVHQVLTYSRSREGRLSTAQRYYYWAPEAIRLLLRYGHAHLEEDELNSRLRFELDHYTRFLLRWSALRRVGRDGSGAARQARGFHAEQIARIHSEAGARAGLRAATRILSRLV